MTQETDSGKVMTMYELYYWPTIQGRGEFVRLALAEASADYIDVVRWPEEDGGGVPAMLALMGAEDDPPFAPFAPFAPPILKDGEVIVSQTPLILDYLGAKHGLAPTDEAQRRWTLQLIMLLADFLIEAHDVHHPLAKEFYYEDQRDEALRRAPSFRDMRIPKFYGYFERVIARNPAASGHLVGDNLTTADLSLFQIIEGMRYAFPRASARLEPNYPGIVALHATVAARPGIVAYVAAGKRISFNEHGIFRHYPELDV